MINKTIIIFTILVNLLNADIGNINIYSSKTTSYKDGYEFAKENENTITGNFLYKYAIKSISFRSGACLMSIGIPLLMGQTGDALFLVIILSPILQAVLTIFDIPLFIKEFKADQSQTFNKSIEDHLNSSNKDFRYKCEFLNGVNRYLQDKKGR